jgi:hypothetical protein
MGKVQFRDGDVIHYIWIRFFLLDPPYGGRLFEWRGWLTPGAMYEAAPVLVACGARLKDDDVTDLDGLDTYAVSIHIKTIECVEAPGVVKTYIDSIERSDPLDMGATGSSKSA